MPTQPGLEILRTLEIEQGIGQCFKGVEGQGLNAGLLVGFEGAAASLELAQGESDGFGLSAFFLALQESYLPAFLSALLPAQPKDFAVGDAVAEVVDGDLPMAQYSTHLAVIPQLSCSKLSITKFFCLVANFFKHRLQGCSVDL